MEDHKLTKLSAHPPSPSQLIFDSRAGGSRGTTPNPVKQLRAVCVDPMASTCTTSLCLTPDSKRVSLGLSLTTPQLSKCSADLLKVAVVPIVDPDVPVKDDSVTSYLRDILVLSLSIRTPNHLKSRQ